MSNNNIFDKDDLVIKLFILEESIFKDLTNFFIEKHKYIINEEKDFFTSLDNIVKEEDIDKYVKLKSKLELENLDKYIQDKYFQSNKTFAIYFSYLDQLVKDINKWIEKNNHFRFHDFFVNEILDLEPVELLDEDFYKTLTTKIYISSIWLNPNELLDKMIKSGNLYMNHGIYTTEKILNEYNKLKTKIIENNKDNAEKIIKRIRIINIRINNITKNDDKELYSLLYKLARNLLYFYSYQIRLYIDTLKVLITAVESVYHAYKTYKTNEFKSSNPHNIKEPDFHDIK